MRPAFGEWGVSGANPPLPACALAANASAAPTTSTHKESLRLTGGWHPKRVEAFTRVELPAGVGDSYEVCVNGVPQEAGEDFDRIGDTLVFRRTLAREGKLGPMRWLSMLLGIAGTYRKHEN